MRRLRILLVDDSAEFLDSAGAFLSRDPRVEVVGRAVDGWNGVLLSRELAPDLVLMDLAMPVMGGLAATNHIKSGPAPPRVVIVTLHDDEEYRRGAREASADGFISKSDFADAVMVLIDSLLKEPAESLDSEGSP